MSLSTLTVWAVVLFAMAADSAMLLILATRRGGQVWKLMALQSAGLWLFTAGWLWTLTVDPHRYDLMRPSLWLSMVARCIVSAAALALALLVLKGNRSPRAKAAE